MRVSELIEALQKANPDYEIMLEDKKPEYWIEEDPETKTVVIRGNS